MPGGNKNIKGTDGNTFSSTNQPKNKGGRKKLLRTIGKEKGYSGEEIRRVFSTILTMTKAEREAYLKKTELDSLEEITILTVNEAIKKKNFAKIKDIIEHVAGRPKELIDLTVENRNDLELAPYETIYIMTFGEEPPKPLYQPKPIELPPGDDEKNNDGSPE